MATPKAPLIIQVMESVFPWAVQAAMVMSPKELMPDWMRMLEKSKVTNCSPAGTPMRRIRPIRGHSMRSFFSSSRFSGIRIKTRMGSTALIS